MELVLSSSSESMEPNHAFITSWSRNALLYMQILLAFFKRPRTDLDALANDPQFLMNLLNAHIADGFYPSGSLSGLTLGHADVTVTNRLGLKWHYVEDYSINDQLIGPSYTVGNGNRVQIIYTLLSSN